LGCVKRTVELKISSPCPKTWEDLVGNDRVRYCGQCKLNVYNLAEMSSEEIEGLIRRTEGRLCGRLYLRGDRTASLMNCPTSARKQRIRRIVAVASVLALAAFAWIFRGMQGPDRSRLPAWVRDAVELIDPQPPSHSYEIVGKICPPPLPPQPPPQPIPTVDN
jgi:hypothetical protein